MTKSKLKVLLAALGAAGLLGVLTRRGSGPGVSAPGSGPSPGLPPDRAGDARRLVVDIALSQLGVQDPDRYWAVVQPGLVSTDAAWCGGFALWVLHEAGLTTRQWEIGKGFLYKLPRTTSPLPGDLAYYDQPLQHHAIVEFVDTGGNVHTIDGNQTGETVARRTRQKSAGVYYSIQPMIEFSNV